MYSDYISALDEISNIIGSNSEAMRQLEQFDPEKIAYEIVSSMRGGADIDRLVDLKTEIRGAIDALPEEKYRYVLEQHYLNGISYGQIGDVLGYHEKHVERIAKKGLSLLKVPPDVETCGKMR